jgi:hypothetical protein
MWTIKRKDRKGFIVGYIEIFQIVFLVLVFAVGAIGFIRAATNEEEKK